MHVPTTGVDYAAALEATGQLAEARALGLDIARMPVRPGEPEAFAEARATASALAERLSPRIPAVVVTVKGLAAGVEPSMTLDGAAVPSGAIGLPRKTNPGTRVIAVSAPGYLPVEKKVDLTEGQTLQVEIVLKPGGPPVTPGVVAVVTPGQVIVPPDDSDRPKRGVPAWAWVSGGVGLVALGVGAYFVADYLSVKSLVSTDCPNNTCGSKIYASDNLPDQLTRWNRDLGAFVGLGAVGVVAVTVAIVGIARTPRARKAVDAHVVPSFAPFITPTAGGGAITGTF